MSLRHSNPSAKRLSHVAAKQGIYKQKRAQTMLSAAPIIGAGICSDASNHGKGQTRCHNLLMRWQDSHKRIRMPSPKAKAGYRPHFTLARVSMQSKRQATAKQMPKSCPTSMAGSCACSETQSPGYCDGVNCIIQKTVAKPAQARS